VGSAELLCVVQAGRAVHEQVSALSAHGPRLAIGLATGDVRASAVPSGVSLLDPVEISSRRPGSRTLCPRRPGGD
jgi:hypothetical protein